jgi:hypothetical protein
VLSYFRQHPLAADHLEGIVRWRMLQEIAVQELEATRQAVRWLVDHGYLIEEQHPGMAPLYRLAPEAPVSGPLAGDGGA